MTFDSGPVPVFTKKFLTFPSTSEDSLNVEANPDPPCVAKWVTLGSRPKPSMIAGSTFGDILDILAANEM